MTKLEELEAKEAAAYKAFTDLEDANARAVRPLREAWQIVFHQLQKERHREELKAEIRAEDREEYLKGERASGARRAEEDRDIHPTRPEE